MGSRALLRRRDESRNSRAQAPRSIRTTGPKFDHGSNNGPYNKAAIAAQRFSEVLADIPVGDIATAAGVSKETAKNWKLGKRMPNGEAMLDLQTHLRAVRDYSKRRWDGHESPQTQQALAAAQYALQSIPPHQREAVMAQLKERI